MIINALMTRLVPSREAEKILGVHSNTLRNWAKDGKIKYITTQAGQRRYDVQDFLGKRSEAIKLAYCRVSSPKQRDDLERQVAHMQEHFPNHVVIKDIGSGLNYKRKGLKSILGRVLAGDKLELVVAHRDRLTRFGFDLIDHIVQSNGGKIMVLSQNSTYSPEQDLTQDLLTILHVFSCRMHGLRKYRDKIKEDQILSHSRTENNS